jgi:hypothetical protein
MAEEEKQPEGNRDSRIKQGAAELLESKVIKEKPLDEQMAMLQEAMEHLMISNKLSEQPKKREETILCCAFNMKHEHTDKGHDAYTPESSLPCEIKSAKWPTKTKLAEGKPIVYRFNYLAPAHKSTSKHNETPEVYLERVYQHYLSIKGGHYWQFHHKEQPVRVYWLPALHMAELLKRRTAEMMEKKKSSRALAIGFTVYLCPHCEHAHKAQHLARCFGAPIKGITRVPTLQEMEQITPIDKVEWSRVQEAVPYGNGGCFVEKKHK